MSTTKILILEHDQQDLELLLHHLKRSDLVYKFLIVDTMEKYEQGLYEFKPDIILSDYSLPNFDGLNAFNLKQEISPETPFIIVSGTLGEENAVELIKKGITDYILKEKMYQVVTKIDRALNEAVVRKKKLLVQQELAEQAELTRNILESITDAFASVDRQWQIKYCNNQAEQILGVKKDDIIDKNVWDLYLGSISMNLYTILHEVMNTHISGSIEAYFESLKVWLCFNIYPSKDGISIFFKDITESKRLENLNNLEKEVLAHYTKQGTTIESTSELLMEGIRKIHPELLLSIMKVRNNKLYHWAFSHLPPAFLEATEGTAIAMGAECGGTAAFLKERVECTNIATDPLWKKNKKLALQNDLKACVAYPCTDPYQKITGTFNVFLKSARPLSEAEQATAVRTKYILQHIIENHNAEESIKISEEKYRDLFHLHPVPLWLLDTETYRFLEVNEAAIINYGYNREEFLNMTIMDIRLDSDLESLMNALAAGKKDGSFSILFTMHQKKNGEIIQVEIKTNQINFMGVKARLVMASDITQKMKAEKALQLSENRFKALVQEGSDLINIVDVNLNYKYASPACANLIGFSQEDAIGINALDFIHKDDQELISKALANIMTIKRIVTPPFRFRDTNGNFRWLQSVSTNLLDDPAVEGIVVNSKDITDSVNHIRAIEEQNIKLRDIAWIQSHIVRAPLTRIMGLIDLLQNYPENEVLAPELLGHIITSANELDKIIRDIVEKSEQVENLAGNNMT
jgi:PAS domain S-box-containing protein